MWLGHSNRVSHVQVSPDGTALASASWDKMIKVEDSYHVCTGMSEVLYVQISGWVDGWRDGLMDE